MYFVNTPSSPAIFLSSASTTSSIFARSSLITSSLDLLSALRALEVVKGRVGSHYDEGLSDREAKFSRHTVLSTSKKKRPESGSCKRIVLSAHTFSFSTSRRTNRCTFSNCLAVSLSLWVPTRNTGAPRA